MSISPSLANDIINKVLLMSLTINLIINLFTFHTYKRNFRLQFKSMFLKSNCNIFFSCNAFLLGKKY